VSETDKQLALRQMALQQALTAAQVTERALYRAWRAECEAWFADESGTMGKAPSSLRLLVWRSAKKQIEQDEAWRNVWRAARKQVEALKALPVYPDNKGGAA